MHTKALQAVFIAAVLNGCAAINIGSVRPTYPADQRLDISCAAFPNDKAEINSRLQQLYEDGWRIAASGMKGGLGAEPFLCFERPAGMEPAKPAKSKAAAKPAPAPAATDDDAAADEDAAPKPAPKKAKKPAAVAPADDSSADDAAADEPAPKAAAPKKRKPVLE